MSIEDPFKRSLLCDEMVLRPFHLSQLDILFAQGLDAAGGIYTPILPITLGGRGVSFGSAGGLTGGVKTGIFAAPGALRLGVNAGIGSWPEFTSNRTLTRIFPIQDIAKPLVKVVSPSPRGLQIISSQATIIGSLRSQYIPRGSVLTSVTLRFRVGIEPNAVPAQLPYMAIGGVVNRPVGMTTVAAPITPIANWVASASYSQYSKVLAIPDRPVFFYKNTSGTQTSGGSQPAAFATAVPGDPTITDGAVSWEVLSKTGDYILTPGMETKLPTPSTTSEYFKNGTIQTLSFSPGMNQVMDTDTYKYHLFIVDNANTMNIYHSVKLVFGSISNMKPAI